MKIYRRPYRIRKKKSILKNRFFWLFILILMILSGVFYLVLFSHFFEVRGSEISGNQKVSLENLEDILKKEIEQKILFFSSKSIFLVNLNQIRKDILNNSPQLAEVEISQGFPDALDVIVIEKLALANFCQNEKCFLLDNKGIIFEEIEPQTNLIKIIDGQKEKMPKLGEQMIERDYLEKILKIQKFFQEELKLEIKEFIVFPQRLNLRMVEGFEIYFDPRADIDWQLTKLNLVLKEKIPSEKRRDLEYIELRFGDLAPFKYR